MCISEIPFGYKFYSWCKDAFNIEGLSTGKNLRSLFCVSVLKALKYWSFLCASTGVYWMLLTGIIEGPASVYQFWRPWSFKVSCVQILLYISAILYSSLPIMHNVWLPKQDKLFPVWVLDSKRNFLWWSGTTGMGVILVNSLRLNHDFRQKIWFDMFVVDLFKLTAISLGWIFIMLFIFGEMTLYTSED